MHLAYLPFHLPCLPMPTTPRLASLLRCSRSAGCVLLLGLALATFGCKSAEQSGSGATDGVRTTLEVQNRNFLDMNIYVVRGGQRVRLGRVTGSSSEVFTIPDYLVRGAGTLRFLADPIGGRNEPVTREILVNRGEEMRLIIPAY